MHGYIWTGRPLQMCSACLMHFFFSPSPCMSVCERDALHPAVGVQVPLFINVVHFLSAGLRPARLLCFGRPTFHTLRWN